MKRQEPYLLILFICLFGKTHAQEYNFPDSGAVWTMREIVNDCVAQHWINRVEGDTVINELTYSILYHEPQCKYFGPQSFCAPHYDPPPFPSLAVGGFREDSGKLYFLKFELSASLNNAIYDVGIASIPSGEEILMYDLAWEIGDSIIYPNGPNHSFICDVVGKNMFMGRQRIGLHVRGENPGEIFSMIEGLGGQRALFNMYYRFFDLIFQCLSIEDEMILESNKSCEMDCSAVVASEIILSTLPVTIYPNPFSDMIMINVTGGGESFQLELFNSQGQRIDSKKVVGNDIWEIGNQILPGTYWLKISDAQGKFMLKQVMKF